MSQIPVAIRVAALSRRNRVPSSRSSLNSAHTIRCCFCAREATSAFHPPAPRMSGSPAPGTRRRRATQFAITRRENTRARARRVSRRETIRTGTNERDLLISVYWKGGSAQTFTHIRYRGLSLLLLLFFCLFVFFLLSRWNGRAHDEKRSFTRRVYYPLRETGGGSVPAAVAPNAGERESEAPLGESESIMVGVTASAPIDARRRIPPRRAHAAATYVPRIIPSCLLARGGFVLRPCYLLSQLVSRLFSSAAVATVTAGVVPSCFVC